MGALTNLAFVFVAGLITDLATGLGALPFFLVEKFSDRWTVGLWGFASGIMVAASLLGLVSEGLAHGTLFEVGVGVIAGVILVLLAHQIIERYEVSPEQYEEADFRTLLFILGILTVHSFPEGVAVGVSFAELGPELGAEHGIPMFGLTVPLLAVFMTIAISIHNIPEGVAVSIPLQSMGVSNWRTVGWAVFSSLPQPIGAVLAYVFVRLARAFLPYGFGFAAGAMIFLVIHELVPEALEIGSDLPNGGRHELVFGFVVGCLAMAPLALV